MSDEFTPTQLKALDQIEKLLNLAAGAGTLEEAAAANAKAQELLTKHNLSAAALEDTNAKQTAKREEAKVEGGRFKWQRQLWSAVAELNFCYYWQRNSVRKDEHGRGIIKYGRYVYFKEHCLIGRVVNTRSTIAMASYLEKAIDRIALGRVGEEGWLMSSSWAFDYRRGAFAAVIKKLRDERRKTLDAEAEAEQQAIKKGENNAAGTALTVTGYAKSEDDANYDFKYGAGAAAEKRQADIEAAEYYARAEAAYTIWAAANPGQAADRFKFKDKDGEISQPFTSRSGGGGKRSIVDDVKDWSAFKTGRADGEKIGLNPQTTGPVERKRITGKKDIYL